MFTVYILYSTALDRYYIGFTGDTIEARLNKHKSRHKGFTGKQSDWKVVYTESYDSKQAAIQREREIKKWKSRVLIQKLIGTTG